MPAAFEISLTENPPEADQQAVLDGLTAHNTPFVGLRDTRPLAVFARRERELMGGLLGETRRGLLHVAALWVQPSARGTGLGTQLLTRAEAEARSRGCRRAWLDTYDFQAKPFYERQGYSVFGELDGYPNGHRRFFMTKALQS